MTNRRNGGQLWQQFTNELANRSAQWLRGGALSLLDERKGYGSFDVEDVVGR